MCYIYELAAQTACTPSVETRTYVHTPCGCVCSHIRSLCLPCFSFQEGNYIDQLSCPLASGLVWLQGGGWRWGGKGGLLLLFSLQVLSDSLRPHGLQHIRLPCPSLSPGVCSNSCPLSQWCHPTISSSVACFSSCLQSFPASGSFPMSQLFTSGGQSIGVSASASVLPMNIQGWFPIELTGLISLQSKGLSRVFSNTTVQKHQFFSAQPSLWSNSHICTWLLEKP